MTLIAPISSAPVDDALARTRALRYGSLADRIAWLTLVEQMLTDANEGLAHLPGVPGSAPDLNRDVAALRRAARAHKRILEERLAQNGPVARARPVALACAGGHAHNCASPPSSSGHAAEISFHIFTSAPENG